MSATYIFKHHSPDLWAAVRVKAEQERITLREALLRALRAWVTAPPGAEGTR